MAATSYASVNNVYSRLKVLLNKQQLGFVTPSQFNQLATQAQQNIFDELIDELDASLKHQLRNTETANKDIKRKVEDDLVTLMVYNRSLVAQDGSTNVFDYPAYHAYTRAISYNGRRVSTISPQDSSYFVNNRYTPTATYAIAVLGNNEIEIIPDSITLGIEITYYKLPMGSINGVAVAQTPSWGYVTSGEDNVYASASSVDFELPKQLEQRITEEIMSLMGISLREEEVVSYAEMQIQKQVANNNR